MKDTELREELKKFDENPRAAMMALPRKRDRADIPLPSGSTFFTEEDIESGDYIDAKNDVRWALSTEIDRPSLAALLAESPVGRSALWEAMATDKGADASRLAGSTPEVVRVVGDAVGWEVGWLPGGATPLKRISR